MSTLVLTIFACVVFTGFMILCTSRGEPGRGFFGVLVFGLTLYLFGFTVGGVPVVDYVGTHWRDVLLWFGVWITGFELASESFLLLR